jgi:competence CoiA-like predicted nuclease
MLTAIKTKDNKKVIGNFIEKDNQSEYICEYCRKNVIHHKSKSQIRTGHFKHRQGDSDCPNQTKETEYHIKTKLDIYSYIQKGWGNQLKLIELEKWICENSIRPDIYIETNKNKIAIEVQATILTVSEIKRRTEKYNLNDINVLWILPFDYERIWERKVVEFGYGYDKNIFDWRLSDKVKMKEMEVFLYWANFKKLIFWDLEHKYSNSFISVGFEEYRGADVEFWRDGLEYSYSGKTAKTIKKATWIKYNLEFTDFRTIFANEFNAPYRGYIIPNRKLFTYDDRKYSR